MSQPVVETAEPDPNKNTTDLISRRAEIFRAKLVHEFNLLETFGEASQTQSSEVPSMSTKDAIDENLSRAMLTNNPSGLIQFSSYNQRKVGHRATADERRLNRVRNKNSKYPSIDVICHFILHSRVFEAFIVVMLFINAIVIGTSVEINQQARDERTIAALVLEAVNLFALLVFIIEICLKLIDNFWTFWTSNWNIVDLSVTIFSLICEIFKYVGMAQGGSNRIAHDLGNLRIIRSVKVIQYFSSARIMVQCIARATKELVFVSILLVIFGYIYAIFGVTAFDYNSVVPDPEFPLSFPFAYSSVVNALKSMWQIFTNDHWMVMLFDARQTSAGVLAYFYIISWLFLGAYIFQNLATGVLVSNYETLRVEYDQEKERPKEQERRQSDLSQLVDKLDEESENRKSSVAMDPRNSQRDGRGSTTARSSAQQPADRGSRGPSPNRPSSGASPNRPSSGASPNRPSSGASNRGTTGQATSPMRGSNRPSERGSNVPHRRSARNSSKLSVMSSRSVFGSSKADWQTMVERNLANLAMDDATFYWPTDTLFQYYLLMEALEENLEERKQLLQMITQAVLAFNDS